MSRRAAAQFGRDIVGAGVASDELCPARSFPVVFSATEAGVRPGRVFAVRRGGVVSVRFEPVVRAAERGEIAGAGRSASAVWLPGDRMVRVACMGRTDAEWERASIMGNVDLFLCSLRRLVTVSADLFVAVQGGADVDCRSEGTGQRGSREPFADRLRGAHDRPRNSFALDLPGGAVLGGAVCSGRFAGSGHTRASRGGIRTGAGGGEGAAGKVEEEFHAGRRRALSIPMWSRA